MSHPMGRVFCCFCYSWESGGGGGRIVIVPFYQALFIYILQDFLFLEFQSPDNLT